jgi:hypothetical protein
MSLYPLAVSITGDDLVELVIVAGIVVCGVVFFQWLLSRIK